MYCIRLCSIQVHIDVPKTMLQISGELYTRVDKGIDGPFTTKPSDVRDYLPCAPATVADSALCNTSESNPPIISEQPKGAEWPAGCSCGLRGDWGPRDRSLAGAVSPDGGLLAKTLRPSCGAPLDVPTPPTVLMQPAAPANDPTACHAPAVDLEAASAVRVNPTAASAAHADRPVPPIRVRPPRRAVLSTRIRHLVILAAAELSGPAGAGVRLPGRWRRGMKQRRQKNTSTPHRPPRSQSGGCAGTWRSPAQERARGHRPASPRRRAGRGGRGRREGRVSCARTRRRTPCSSSAVTAGCAPVT